MGKIRVLLIVDNPGYVLLATEALQETKFLVHIEVAKNGKEGTYYFFRDSEVPWGLLLTCYIWISIFLPLKSGYDVLREVKQNDFTKNLPVAMLTTSSSQANSMRSYQQQASCYLVKPNEVDQFSEFVKVFDRFCDTLYLYP